MGESGRKLSLGEGCWAGHSVGLLFKRQSSPCSHRLSPGFQTQDNTTLPWPHSCGWKVLRTGREMVPFGGVALRPRVGFEYYGFFND